MRLNTDQKIAITGYGCITAAGKTADAARLRISSGMVNNVQTGAEFFPANFSAPCFRIPDAWLSVPGDNRSIEPGGSAENRTINLALSAIQQGLEKAGLALDELRTKRVGIALGTTVGCTFHNEEYYKEWKSGKVSDEQPLFTYLTANLAEKISEILGVSGPRVVITNACASGTDAIGVAKSWLQYGLCDIAIAGGADELSRIACHGFKSLMLVSRESCRPFDRNRQGLNLGEGAGVFILEPEQMAIRRKSSVLGRVLGYGIAGDAHHPTAPHADARGLQLAVKKAMKDAELNITSIALINGHGTGTPANDKAETNGVLGLGFQSHTVPLISTKGATGHTLGAAGGVEAVFTLLDLNAGEVAGTVGCKEPDETICYEPLPEGETAVLKGTIGLTQSLAFGGSNGALIIEGALS